MVAEALQKQGAAEKLFNMKRRSAMLFGTNNSDKIRHDILRSRAIGDTGNLLVPPTHSEECVRNLAVSPVKVEKYFGFHARQDFFDKVNAVNQEEKIKGMAGMKESQIKPTAFLPSKEEIVDFPFQVKRPVKKDRSASRRQGWAEPLGDVSCLDNFDDRPGVHPVDASTVCSLDYQEINDYDHNQPSSPRTTFISGCIQEKLNPRVSYLMRKNVSIELNLQHQGKLKLYLLSYMNNYFEYLLIIIVLLFEVGCYCLTLINNLIF
jgi:hypothetical protein